MHEFWKELDKKMAVLPRKLAKVTKTNRRIRIHKVIELAGWIQHQIVSVHPFCEGNGRVASLMTNMILSRYGFPHSELSYEGDNKKKYLDALCRIDKLGDYRALNGLIMRGVIEGYQREIKIREINKK